MAAYASYTDIIGVGSTFTLPSGWVQADVEAVVVNMQAYINELVKDDFSGSQSLSLLIDGEGFKTLSTLRYTKMPIISISSITWRATPADNFESSNEWDTEDFVNRKYYVEAIGPDATARVGARDRFVRGLKNYRINGNFGWETVPVPIKLATIQLVRNEIKPGYLDQVNVTSVHWPDYGYSVGKNTNKIPVITGFPNVDNYLQRYIRRSPILETISGEP